MAAELFSACRRGDLPRVVSCLQGKQEQRLDVNKTCDRDGQTPLFFACLGAHAGAVVRWLVREGGADVNRRDAFQQTPLFVLAAKGNTDVMCWLLDHGADPSLVDHQGQTALFAAVGRGRLETATALAAATRDLNIDLRDHSGKTMLSIAAAKGYLGLVQWLLGAGALVNRADWRGNTPLSHACAAGHLDVVQWLVEHAGAKTLLRMSNKSALWHASRNGHLEVVRWLYSHGATEANVNFPVLGAACDGGHLLVARWLLDNTDAQPGGGPRDSGMHLPVVIAARGGYLKLLQYLIERGAALHPLALHAACESGHLHVVDWLLRELIRHRKREDGWILTARKSFRSLGRKQVPPELRVCAGPRRYTPVHAAVSQGRLEVVRYLIESHNVGPGFEVMGRGTLLNVALEHNRTHVARFLIEGCEADVNLPSAAGSVSPLHVVARTGNLDLARLLTIHGADVSLRDASGRTAVGLARMWLQEDVEHWLVTTAGWSPIQMATLARWPDMIEAKLREGCRGWDPFVRDALSPSLREIAHQTPPRHCSRTEAIACLAEQPWSPRTNHLFGPQFRAVVRTILLVAQRQARTSPNTALPIEAWLHILSHCTRSFF
eukprot:m.311459 g.311459  ORF g.311459 m.311459 type:complete len:606 (-) comp19653_c0_seq2:50-1867(-)